MLLLNVFIYMILSSSFSRSISVLAIKSTTIIIKQCINTEAADARAHMRRHTRKQTHTHITMENNPITLRWSNLDMSVLRESVLI